MAIKTYKDMDGSLEKIMRSSEDEINNGFRWRIKQWIKN
jgi:hypothetical protein